MLFDILLSFLYVILYYIIVIFILVSFNNLCVKGIKGPSHIAAN